MIRKMVEAYVDVKMERADISVALYNVAREVGGPALVKRGMQRLQKAIEVMIRTAPDIEAQPNNFAIEMMLAAMSGAMRSVLEARRSVVMRRKLRENLVLLCQSYMTAVTTGRS